MKLAHTIIAYNLIIILTTLFIPVSWPDLAPLVLLLMYIIGLIVVMLVWLKVSDA